jgi:hypothetical protein
MCRLRLKCDGTRAESRFRLLAKRTSPFKSAGASVQSTTGSRDVRISGSNVGCTMLRGSVKSAGYPLHSPVSPSLPLPASSCAIAFQLDSTNGVSSQRFARVPKRVQAYVFPTPVTTNTKLSIQQYTVKVKQSRYRPGVAQRVPGS